jgi:hypothetical protein
MNYDGSAKIEAWKPGVSRSVLLRIAGVTWIGVSILLNGLSYSWLRTEKPVSALLAVVVGIVFALLIHYFGFLHIVDKNMARILPMEGRRCAFAFMSWKSYILVFAMIFMGFLLRNSVIPKLYVAILYTAIGTALLLSSVRYLRYARLVQRSRPGDEKGTRTGLTLT